MRVLYTHIKYIHLCIVIDGRPGRSGSKIVLGQSQLISVRPNRTAAEQPL